jgi:UPF0755 protein
MSTEGEGPTTAEMPDTGEVTGSPVARGAERRLRRRRRRRIVFLIGGLFLLAVIGLVAFYEIEAHPFGGPGKNEVVTVRPHESADAVISDLAGRGVIGSTFAFRISDVIHGTPTLQVGSYLFRQNQSFSTVRNVLMHGPDVYTLTVLPGFTLSEVEQRVAELPYPSPSSFAKAVTASVDTPYEPPGTNSLEGELGAGSYQVLPGESGATLLHQMIGRFEAEARSLDLTQAAASLSVTPSQLLIISSIVEKEGYIPVNMGKVARVIYNRLAAGTPLQMDSTVLYAKGQDGGTVTAADLKIASPYNTYLHTGLPPTAICVPSKAALTAAANPVPGSWLYFELVSKDGTLQFSDTYAEQLAAEQLAASRGLP